MPDTKLNREAIRALAYGMIRGADPKPGEPFHFEHRFGDEGPGSYTRCVIEPTEEQIAQAEMLVACWYKP